MAERRCSLHSIAYAKRNLQTKLREELDEKEVKEERDELSAASITENITAVGLPEKDDAKSALRRGIRNA